MKEKKNKSMEKPVKKKVSLPRAFEILLRKVSRGAGADAQTSG